MRLPAMTDAEFSDFIDAQVPDNPTILKYLITTRNKLREYQRIAVSYSGGSDSDIVIDLIELVKPPDCGKICYILLIRGSNGMPQRSMLKIRQMNMELILKHARHIGLSHLLVKNMAYRSSAKTAAIKSTDYRRMASSSTLLCRI